MSDIASLPARRLIGAGWLLFATVNCVLMFEFPGKETIPYHLIWASFAYLYGLIRWSRQITWICFSAITIFTGVPLIRHAATGYIGWEECSEIVLMGIIVALLVWHVDRQRATQDNLQVRNMLEARRNENREITAQFGSHEVRTRLTIARGFVELMKNCTNPLALRKDADIVLGELDKASALTTKLLTLVRVEAPSPREPIHLDDLIENIMRRWKSTAIRNWSASSTVGVMFGDPERIEAAMDCLIENAVKFTEADDSINVRAWRQGDAVLLSVADSGPGIPAGDVDRIVDVFQTGSEAGLRAGSGLGLAIVRAIAQARRGSLEVHSVEGRGARFTIRFPTTLSEPSAQDPEFAAPPVRADEASRAIRTIVQTLPGDQTDVQLQIG
jgi:signal transduction histidine kinase